jgi:hypothetical protein
VNFSEMVVLTPGVGEKGKVPSASWVVWVSKKGFGRGMKLACPYTVFLERKSGDGGCTSCAKSSTML